MLGKRVWLLIVCVFGIAIVWGLYYGRKTATQEPIKIYKPVEVGQPAASPEKPSESGHWHGDIWHAVDQEGSEPPAAREVRYTAPQGAATTPDFPPVDPNEDPVVAAYKRLEYIKNNPYAWGGVHSPRATELIAALMPPPVLRDEGHGEEVIAQIEELIAQGDPRAAEVLITNLCEGYVGGKRMTDAVVEIGPPSIPYILPYVSEAYVKAAIAVEALGRIGAVHRGDLGGIVEHIILPKLEDIAAADFERYDLFAVEWAQKGLEGLQ